MFKTQFGEAKYSEIAFAIPTRIDGSGTYGVIEVKEEDSRMSEIRYVGQMSSSQNSRVIDPSGISYAVTNGHKDGEPKIIEALAVGRERTEEEKKRRRIHGDKGAKFSQGKQLCFLGDVSGCITTLASKDNLVGEFYASIQNDYVAAEPLRIPQATKKGYVEVMPGGLFDMSYPESTTRRGRVQEGGKVSPTLMGSGEASCFYEGMEGKSYRIRKLTPKECFRLMGVTETDIDKIQQSGVSQSQQYKMAGNSIVVDCLFHIFRKMFVDTGQESQQLSLF